jgi:hypothetical protein
LAETLDTLLNGGMFHIQNIEIINVEYVTTERERARKAEKEGRTKEEDGRKTTEGVR